MGAQDVAAGIRLLNESGIPTYATPEEAVNTFMEMYSYTRNLELLQATPPRLPVDLKVNTRQVRTFIDESLKRQKLLLTEVEAKAILSAYGIRVNPTVTASSASAAATAAKKMGFPVVLKINSPDISHKSEVGGVKTFLKNGADVMTAFDEIISRARAARPEAKIYGVTVQTQVESPDLELILGAKKDPQFGPLLLFGLGGVLTEILKDTSVELPPLNLLLARRLMQRTRAYEVLQGYRNLPPARLDLLEETLVRLSQLVTDFPEIVELDLNPLFIAAGQPVCVDARILLEPTPVRAPRHLIIAPYPNQYESDWLLKDGTPVLLRPMKPEDESLLEEFLNTCSEETIYSRHFKLIKKWTHRMLARFTQTDYDRELALIAIGQPPGPETILGVGRLVMTSDRSRAEFAVIVADPWQGKGLGEKLIERIIEIARESGVKLLWGAILAENLPMLNLVKKMGFGCGPAEDCVRQVELPLAAG